MFQPTLGLVRVITTQGKLGKSAVFQKNQENRRKLKKFSLSLAKLREN